MSLCQPQLPDAYNLICLAYKLQHMIIYNPRIPSSQYVMCAEGIVINFIAFILSFLPRNPPFCSLRLIRREQGIVSLTM